MIRHSRRRPTPPLLSTIQILYGGVALIVNLAVFFWNSYMRAVSTRLEERGLGTAVNPASSVALIRKLARSVEACGDNDLLMTLMEE